MRHFQSSRAVRHARFLLVVPLLTLSVCVVGCGPENELGRLPFSGTVTLDGKPLKSGSISLEPTGEEGTRGGATITDGQFAVEEMNGLPPGEYLVRINAASGADAPPEDQPPGESNVIQKELIPANYNTNSEETITISEGKENIFKFDITTSG